MNNLHFLNLQFSACADMSEQSNIGTPSRTRAREAALMFLFATEFNPQKLSDIPYFVDVIFPIVLTDYESAPGALHLNSTAREFAVELIQGVMINKAEIDDTLISIAERWSLSRMSTVDRNILRLATYEIMQREDIPSKVSINEGINLAKRFGAEKSGAFVNSILDKVKTLKETRDL